ncbi:SPJ_0845 family protein [Carnobacterium divergens]|nr:SPJ_0845 family protein [Carnobacterium divergens]
MGLTHKTETSLDDLFSKFAVEPKEKKREEDDDEKEKKTKIKKKSNK